MLEESAGVVCREAADLDPTDADTARKGRGRPGEGEPEERARDRDDERADERAAPGEPGAPPPPDTASRTSCGRLTGQGAAKDTCWVGLLRLLELAKAPLDRQRLEHVGGIPLEVGNQLLVRAVFKPPLDVGTLDAKRVSDLIERAAVDLPVSADTHDEATELAVRRLHRQREEIDMRAVPRWPVAS